MRNSSTTLIALILIGESSIVAGFSNDPLKSVTNAFSAFPSLATKLGVFTSLEQEESVVNDSTCPTGYYYNSLQNSCTQLGPIGRLSQAVETFGPFKKAYLAISNLFGIDPNRISSLGVAFALSYSMMSQINGSITLSVAWYMASQRTGLSPLAPGEWKSLLAAYATLYGIVQVLKPFRVAAAIGMSKLSKEFLEATEEKLSCNRRTAIVFQYALGWVVWLGLATVGVTIASTASGVPVLTLKQ